MANKIVDCQSSLSQAEKLGSDVLTSLWTLMMCTTGHLHVIKIALHSALFMQIQTRFISNMTSKQFQILTHNKYCYPFIHIGLQLVFRLFLLIYDYTKFLHKNYRMRIFLSSQWSFPYSLKSILLLSYSYLYIQFSIAVIKINTFKDVFDNIFSMKRYKPSN